MEFKIEWVGTPNFREGRGGRKIIAIVDHITAGLMPGCLSWMQNPKAQASAHYLVTRDGRIYQLVKDEDTAWHAGIVNKPSWPLYDRTNPNRYTLGIEHEGLPNEPLAEPQYQATLWLHRQLVNKHGIPVDRDHIIGHYRIDSVNKANCPGPKFPWDRLFADLKGGNQKMAKAPEWKIQAVKDAENAGIIMKDRHKPEEIPDKAFVLAVVLNAMKKVKEE